MLAVALIDFAIFGTLGALWGAAAAFIVVVIRWVMRREAGARVMPAPVAAPVIRANAQSVAAA